MTLDKTKNPFGCLHVDYIAQGDDKFLFQIKKQSETSQTHVLFADKIGHQTDWSTVNIDVNLAGIEKQLFTFEAICQTCTKGSTFSLSKVELTWKKCPK